MPGSFLDTNILIYLTSADSAKATRAERVVADGGIISVQVLNETTAVLRRKWVSPGMKRDDFSPRCAAF